MNDNKIINMKCPREGCHWNKMVIPMPEGSSCALCNSKMIASDETNWLKEYGLDDKWLADATEKWPCVLAFEYQRLRRLCLDSNSYGVLLCLKDNFEAILKFEVLISFAWARNIGNESIEKDVISRITTPNLSFGSWRALARDIITGLKKSGIVLPKSIPLDTVKRA